MNLIQKTNYFKIMRADITRELMRDANAFTLLALIAFRAKRTNGLSVHNLQPGEALIGDFENCGLTEQKYRSAKNRLRSYGLATFKSTNKGTIARLVNTNVFDVNITEANEQSNIPATDKQRLSRRDKNDKNINTPLPPSGDLVKSLIIPDSLNAEAFRDKWQKWIEYRKTRAKVKDWFMLFSEQLEWLAHSNAETAIEILSQSIRNGYTGIFPLKSGNKQAETSTPRRRSKFDE